MYPIENKKYMSNKTAQWWELPVPAVFPQTYLRIAQERGIPAQIILEQAQLPLDYARTPGDLTMAQMERLILAVWDVTGNNGLGLDVGWQLPPTAFGNFGYALLCSATMADAIQLCHRYWHLVAPGTALSLRSEGAWFVIEISIPSILEPRFHQLFLEVTFTSLCHGFQLLTGTSVNELDVWFDFAEPEYADRARQRLGTVRYGKANNQVRFPTHLLDTQLGMHNPMALKFAIEQCDRESALSHAQSNKLEAVVRERMVFSVNGYPGLETISRQLNMTSRTLRRRLEQEGTCFKTLLGDAKRRDAVRMLDDHDLEIQKVAGMLGYRDPANFTRAFRQWTGQSPSEYRRTRRSG